MRDAGQALSQRAGPEREGPAGRAPGGRAPLLSIADLPPLRPWTGEFNAGDHVSADRPGDRETDRANNGRQSVEANGDRPSELLIQVLQELTPQLRGVEPSHCPQLIGILERLKAQVWARLLSLQSTSTDADEDGLLDMAEVAKALKITEHRAYELARQGKLPVVRLGKYVRMTRKNLKRYIGRLEAENKY